jgi:hypothetical protein
MCRKQTCSQYFVFKYQYQYLGSKYQYQYQYLGSKYQYQYLGLRSNTCTSISFPCSFGH